jgi:hypothetical protein
MRRKTMSDDKKDDLEGETTYSGIYTDDWEPDETTITEEDLATKEKPFKTDMITKSTQLVCPQCGGKNYIKDGKCVRCDHHLI